MLCTKQMQGILGMRMITVVTCIHIQTWTHINVLRMGEEVAG